jgi:hypothetical protein
VSDDVHRKKLENHEIKNNQTLPSSWIISKSSIEAFEMSEDSAIDSEQNSEDGYEVSYDEIAMLNKGKD